MITDRNALKCAETLVLFCSEQGGCQNCVFHEYHSDHWDCLFEAFKLKYGIPDVKANIEAKKKNHGWL